MNPENITPIKYDSSWHASPTSTMKNDDINKLHEVRDQQVGQHGVAIKKKKVRFCGLAFYGKKYLLIR